MRCPIELRREDPVARVVLNRPQVHNALDEAMIARLTDTLVELEADPQVRVVILEGAGRSFCAGADLAWMKRASRYDEARNREDARSLELMLRTLDELEKPTVALVHGAAIGGGLGLAAACDLTLAAPGATFGLSEVRLGLVPGVIAPFVMRAIGGRQLRRYALTAERFDAETARALGLVHEIVSPERLDERAREVARLLLLGGPQAQAEAKRLVQICVAMPQGGALLAEATVGSIALRRASEEGREGIAAFLEKREPAWREPLHVVPENDPPG